MAEAVKVVVRVRPMNAKEKERGCLNAVDVDAKDKQVLLRKQNTKEPAKAFSFDSVFAPETKQSLIYEESAFLLVESVLDGYNGTIFAYGQTGCGKTHTMMGGHDQESKGIIPRTFSQIITETKNDTSKTHLIRCSFIEIYNEEIHDLLGKDTKARMDLKESPDKGIFIKDLTQIKVDTIGKMEQYMEAGFSNRATRATNMNAESSRSHSLFTIYIDSQDTDEKGNDKYKASKLNLVDLAGSERAAKTGTTGEGMKEATKINLSLSALGNVISALVDGKTHHIPYRDSKLTRLLQDSLGGNTKTIMIAAVSPANYNYDETLSTLRYASRAKFIQNKPKINEDPKDALLREYTDEIKKLKLMLEGKMPVSTMASTATSNQSGEVTYKDRVVYKELDNKENKILEEELKNKNNLLRDEQNEKVLLREKLEQLQKNFEKQGPDNEDRSEMERIRKLKEKLKVQKKKEEEFRREKERRENELLHIEKNYKSLNEEVDEMRTRFQQIKKKYTANLVELKDVQDEHEEEKEELLDTIRYQEKEVKKYQAIMAILMNPDQVETIINNAQWSEEGRQWDIPHFTYREKVVNFPKLHGMTKDMIDQERDRKEIVFRDSKRDKDFDRRASYDGYKINSIVRNAREGDPPQGMASVASGQYFKGGMSGKTSHLTPLKTESYDRAKADLLLFDDSRKKRTERLDPISIGGNDNKKYV